MAPDPQAEREASRTIEALLQRYAVLNDAGRWAEVAELFTEDARFARPSDPAHLIVGRAAILAAFQARPPGPPRRHLVADVQVALDGPDAARALSLSIALADLGAEGGSIAVGGFRDRLQRVAGQWRFYERAGFTTIEPVRHAVRDSLRWPRLTDPEAS